MSSKGKGKLEVGGGGGGGLLMSKWTFHALMVTWGEYDVFTGCSSPPKCSEKFLQLDSAREKIMSLSVYMYLS